MKTLLISTALVAIVNSLGWAEKIPFCKDVPAYTDCQSPNGSGGWTMTVFNLTEKERKYLREADKRTEAQRKNAEAIKSRSIISMRNKMTGEYVVIGSSPLYCIDALHNLIISTSAGKIEAVWGEKRVEVPVRMVCDVWGHDYEIFSFCKICHRCKIHININSGEVIER